MAPKTKKKPISGIQTDASEGQLSMDIYQTADQIVIVAPIAGIEQKDIKISVTDDVLMIKGKRQFPIDSEVEMSCFTQECFWGNFSRSIVLPDNIDSSKIDASFHNAVLTITIPKVEKLRTKVVQIKS